MPVSCLKLRLKLLREGGVAALQGDAQDAVAGVAVLSLNTQVELFPSNIIASMFHFTKSEFFELADDEQEARKAVKVKF